MASAGFVFLSENWLYVKVLKRFGEKEQKESVFLSRENPPSFSSFGIRNWNCE